MARSLHLAMAGLVSLVFPGVGAAAAPVGAEAYIRDAEAAWVAAEVSGDPSVALRVLADDYTGVLPDGTTGHKMDVVAFFKPNNALAKGHLRLRQCPLLWRYGGRPRAGNGYETGGERDPERPAHFHRRMAFAKW